VPVGRTTLALISSHEFTFGIMRSDLQYSMFAKRFDAWHVLVNPNH
jgi:hypothetical protein